MVEEVSIIGCGWLGLPLASELLAKGYEVKGSTTTLEKLSQLKAIGIKPYVLNLPAGNQESLKDFFSSKTIVFNIPPGLRSGEEDDYLLNIESFLQLLSMATFEKLIHMSTTSIYGDINGLCAEKDADDSSIHYVVEQMLGTFCKKNQKKFISVRCGGLMGYDRFPCKYYNDNSVVRNGNSGVNYVHRDDAVEVLVKLVENKTFEGAINLCAPLHPSRQSVIENCASKASRSLPIFEPSKSLGKLVSTELLEKKIGHLFRYPNPLDFFYDFMQ